MDRLTYIGHATTLLELDHVSILTDPVLRGRLGPLRRRGPVPKPDVPTSADAVLISHLHRDHLDVPSLRRVPPNTPMLVPTGAADLVARSGARVIKEVRAGEVVPVAGLEVTAVRAAHNGRRDRWGSEVEPLGYVIRQGGRSVYFAGDTDLFSEMSTLRPLDVALLPVWGWGPSIGSGHLDPQRAARALVLLRPRLAIPIHWGTFYPLGLRRLRPMQLTEPPRAFATAAHRVAPETEVRIVEPGSHTSLETG